MMAAWAPGIRRHHGALYCGIYTRTIVRSSVVKWILHAQIRHPGCNDAVFVGEDYIEVKEVGQQGHLQTITTKADFDARITAAAVFNTNDEDTEADFLAEIKQERSQDDGRQCPPQLVVLTLDTDNLVFVALKYGDDGIPRFIQCIVPLPTFDRTLFQPGQHLAVDPFSRAVAVAAREDQIVLYGTKPKEQLKFELSSQPSEFCPISSTRPFQIDGVIQHMDFLIPPSTSSDHVVLLLITICRGRTKATRIEWSHSLGPRRAQLHPAQVLDDSESIPSLLIPLRDASFLLVRDNHVTLWKDILSGSATDAGWSLLEDEPRYPGLSPRFPAWANWTKPPRSKATLRQKDVMYLVREDGKVIWITVKLGPSPTVDMSHAGDLDCHVGTAFASLGDEGSPDILAVAGETSTGRTVSIGPFFTPRRTPDMSREEAMKFDLIQTIPNWASATDMMSAKELHANRHQSNHIDNVLVTSGRQPYGTVTEIRRGLEGRMAASVPLDILRSVTDLWAVPDRLMGSVVLVLSSPQGTKLFQIDGEFEEILEIEDMTAFDLSQSTLTAGIIASGQLVQVTSHGFCVTGSIQGNFEDTVRKECEGNTIILVAQLIYDDNSLATVEEDESGCSVCCYTLTSTDNEPHVQVRGSARLTSTALCIAAAKIGPAVLVATSTADGTIEVVHFTDTESTSSTITTQLPESSAKVDSRGICDHITILQARDGAEEPAILSISCGLRDGRIVIFLLDLDPGTENNLKLSKEIAFRDSTVKLVPLNNDKSAAYALSGSDLCLLNWDGSIENIWLADKAEPDMAQPSIITCAQTPQDIWLSSKTMADLLVAVSEDELHFAAVQPGSTTVPRQIPVDGTPNRLIHAESLRSIVCSTLFADVRTFPSRSNRPPEERRQIWPIVHFIPSSKDGGTTYLHHMQPGDRVNAILEWTYTATESNKLYSYIVVGGKHIRRSGQAQGRVTFLKARFRNRKFGQVDGVAEVYKIDFADEVTALAQLDNHTIVICAGELVYRYAYREEINEWQHVQSSNGSHNDFRLGSPVVHATVDTPSGDSEYQQPEIILSTTRDSLVVLDASQGSVTTMGPHAANFLSHHMLPGDYSYSNSDLRCRSALATTRTGDIMGMAWQAGSKGEPIKIDFTAQLRRSLTRLVRSPPVARKGEKNENFLCDRHIGSATDGALVALQVIDPTLSDRLSWLQRLIEWSPVLSPHAQQTPVYDRKGDGAGGVERAVPIGFGGSGDHPHVLLHARNRPTDDAHGDGDVLARVLEKGGEEEVRRVMRMLAAETETAVGRWMAGNLERELDELESVVGEVRELDRWVM